MRRALINLTPLQQRVAREIIALARRDNLPAGHHLGKLALAREIGTSHNPVEAALAHLARLGVVRHERDRGYFLARSAHELGTAAEKLAPAGDDPLYLNMSWHRLTHRLPDVVNETDLIRQFGASRNAVRKALARIQQEGWAERRPGHGWAFLPMIDSPEAYDESFEIRRMLEPAGIASPRFRHDPAALAACRRQQEFIVARGYRTMTPIELWDVNARFHEMLASWSGNRFMLQTIRRLNQLRRLVEYRQTVRLPHRKQAEEHLRIIEAIARNDYPRAASLMRDHLKGAQRKKVQPAYFAAPRASRTKP